MSKFLMIVALALFSGAALVGCHASGSIDDASSIVVPR
jgi:hypothetical protein